MSRVTGLLGAALLVLLAFVASASPALAQCVPDPPVSGDTVVCSGLDEDGFEAPVGVDDVDVELESNSNVRPGPLDAAVLIREDSTVDSRGRIDVGGSFGGDTGIVAGRGSAVLIRQAGGLVVVGQPETEDEGGNTVPGVRVDGGVGVELLGGDTQKDGAGVRNLGAIGVFGDDAVGVLAGDRATGADPSDAAVGIWNSGATSLIQIDGDRSIGIDAGSDIGVTSTVDPDLVTGILNEGQIGVLGDDTIGIRAADRNGIKNSGFIGTVGVNSTAIEVGGGNVVVNEASGTIEALDASGPDPGDLVIDTGVGVRFAPSDPGAPGAGNTFINFGTVTAAIAVQGSDAADRVENSFDLQGEVQLEGGDDHFAQRWGARTTEVVDAGVGTDTLQLFGDVVGNDPSDTVAIDLEFIQGFEVLTIEDGGRYVFSNGAPSAKFGDSAAIVDGYLRVEGDIEFGGSYDQSADGVLAVGLFEDGNSDSLDVAGTTTLDPDSVLSVSFGGVDTIGQTYTVLTTGDFAAGSEFGEIVTENFAVLSVVPTYTANSVMLDVIRTRSLASFGANPNDRDVGAYIDQTIPDASGPYEDALNELLASTGPEISYGLAQLNPESYDAQTATVLEWGRKQASLLAAPPPRCDRFVYPRRRSVKTDAPCGATGWTPWVVGLGYFGKRTSGDLYKSFDSTGGGLVIGVDYRVNDRFWVRADVGGGRIDLDIEDDADGQLSSLDVGIASGVQIANGEIHGLFSYGHGWYDTTQELDFLGARTSGDSRSNRYSFELGGSYRFDYRRVYFEPLLSVNYSKFDADRVKESGAQGMGVNLDPRSYDLVATDLGLRVSADLFKYVYVGDILEWADGVWHPELKVSWRETWTDYDRKLSATMVGAPQDVEAFTVQASDAKRGVELGAHIRFQPLGSRVTAAVGYDGFVGDRSDIHIVSGTVRVPF